MLHYIINRSTSVLKYTVIKVQLTECTVQKGILHIFPFSFCRLHVALVIIVVVVNLRKTLILADQSLSVSKACHKLPYILAYKSLSHISCPLYTRVYMVPIHSFAFRRLPTPVCFHSAKVRVLNWVHFQRKLSPKGLRHLFHANSIDFNQLVLLNFDLSLYLYRNFFLRLSLSDSLSWFRLSDSLKQNHFTFWLKSGLRPNFGLPKC